MTGVKLERTVYPDPVAGVARARDRDSLDVYAGVGQDRQARDEPGLELEDGRRLGARPSTVPGWTLVARAISRAASDTPFM